MCKLLSNESDICLMMQKIEVGPIAGGEIVGATETGVKVFKHLMQIMIRDSFQKYEENFIL